MLDERNGYQPTSGASTPAKPPSGGSAASKPADTIRFLGDLERLEVKLGDKFVLTCDAHLSTEHHRRIQEAWRAFIGGDANELKLLILDGGMKLGVVSEASGDNTDLAPKG